MTEFGKNFIGNTVLKRLLTFFVITVLVYFLVWFQTNGQYRSISSVRSRIEKLLTAADRSLNNELKEIVENLPGQKPTQEEFFRRYSQVDKGLFIYKKDSLFYWNRNNLVIEDSLKNSVDNKILFSQNGMWYLLRKAKRGDFSVLLVENIKEIQSVLKNGYVLSSEKNCTQPAVAIHFTVNKIPLCLIPVRDKTESKSFTMLTVLFFLAYFIILLILSELYLKLIAFSKKKHLYFLFFVIDVSLLFVLGEYFRFPKIIWNSPFFMHSFTFLYVDLSTGEYILLLLSVYVAADLFRKLLRIQPLSDRILKIISSFSAQVLAFLLLYLLYIYLESLKSSLLFNLISISGEQLTGYLIIAVTGFVFLHLIRISIIGLDPENNIKTLKYSAVVLILVLIVALILNAPYELIFIYLFLYLSLFATLFYLYRRSNYFGYIVSIVILSMAALLLINLTAIEKQKDNQRFVADYLIQKSDPLFEYKLSGNVKKMLSDSVINALLNLKDTDYNEERLKEYIGKKYFTHHDSYDFQLTWCRKNMMLEVQPEGTLMPCSDYFKTIPGTLAEKDSCFEIKRAQSDFRTIYYIVTINGCNTDAENNSLVLEFVKEKFPAGVGYTDLLQSERTERLDLENYSFALYDNEKLLYKFGDFLYPSVSKEIENFKTNQLFRWSGYYHLIKKDNDNNKLIVSRKAAPFLIVFFPFTLFFIFYLSALLLYFAVISYSKIKEGQLLNYRNKIQLIYLISFVSVFGILSGVSLYFINLGNRRTVINELEEKTHSVTAELQDEFFAHPDELFHSEMILTNLSNYYFTDINLYDSNGLLIETSRPAIFDKKLQSSIINPKAYNAVKLQHKLFYVEKEQIGFRQFYSAYMPLYWDNGQLAAFVNLPYFAKVKSLIQNRNVLIISFLNLLSVLVILLITVSYYVTRMITKPLFILQKRIEETNLDDETETIVWNRDDEIGKLIEAYNNMVNKLKESTELLKKSERESAWREMAQQIAHEIRNPLTPMKLNIQYLMKSKAQNDPGFDEKLKNISDTLISQIDALNNVAAMFSDFAKTKRNTNSVADLKEMVSKAVMLFKARENVSIKTNWNKNESYTVTGDPEDYLRIFNNLIKNSVQALGERKQGEINIEITKTGNNVVVTISDNGPGIDEQYMKKIFEPYFTTKSRGSGIGLAIVRNLVKELNGTISVQSERGEGTRFTLTFPLSNKPA